MSTRGHLRHSCHRLARTLLLAAFVTACESSTEPEGTATLEVRIDSASVLVASVVVEVTAPDITAPLAFNLVLANGSATGSITVPAGSARTITVRAFDSSVIETHRGSTVRTLVAGGNAAVTITLLPLGADQPITVTIGSYVVSVGPASDTVAVNDTVRFIGTVTDGTNPLAVRPRWASLNPAIATVDTLGLVRGIAAGVTGIVASYGGAGALAQVTVTGVAAPPPPGVACLTQAEIDLVNLINGARADSGRAPLTVDTRLIQASRLNISRLRDATTLDSLEWGSSYGVTAQAQDFAWGPVTAASVWNAWIADIPNSPTRQTVWAFLLGPNARLLGVARETTAGVTPQPRWSVIGSSNATAVTDGSCVP